MLRCISLLVCRFLDAATTRQSVRSARRRPKNAKARSRGKLGTGWQQALWRFNVGADLDDGRSTITRPSRYLHGHEVTRLTTPDLAALSHARPNFHEPFLALTEYDKGIRGTPSGSRHILSDAGTKLVRPRQGKTSCSRNVVIVSPASMSPPRTVESECIHSRVD